MAELKPYLIWSNEHGAWWRPESAGYTKIIGQAGQYSKSEADAICKDGGRARAWSEGMGPYEVAVLAPDEPRTPDPLVGELVEALRELKTLLISMKGGSCVEYCNVSYDRRDTPIVVDKAIGDIYALIAKYDASKEKADG